MSKHLFGMFLTHEGTFANNRGESEGTATTLQKVLRGGDLYTTVSSEAIRYALREGWQEMGVKLNRTIKPQEEDNRDTLTFADGAFQEWDQYVDDDLLGFMHAKKETVSRRAILEISRAISTTPWRGELMNNFASAGSNPAVTTGNPIPYAVEVHHTRYQFGFALTPSAIGREGLPPNATEHLDAEEKLRRVRLALQGLLNLRRVGGNHTRYLGDYSPEAVLLRWTDDPAPRFLYCFEQGEHGDISLQPLLQRTGKESGDILGSELTLGTPLDIPELEELKEMDAKHSTSVKAAVEQALNKITEEGLTE